MNSLLGGWGYYGKMRGFHVTCIPVPQLGHAEQEKRAVERCHPTAPSPSRAGLRLNPRGRLRALDNCLLWGCYWSLWQKGVSQACWWVIWYRRSWRQELRIAPRPAADPGWWLLFKSTAEVSMYLWHFLKMAEETRSWQMILPLLLANFGVAAFTNRCWHVPRSQNSPMSLFWGFPTPKPVEWRQVSSGVSVLYPL